VRIELVGMKWVSKLGHETNLETTITRRLKEDLVSSLLFVITMASANSPGIASSTALICTDSIIIKGYFKIHLL
jgi:hypothetical protein